ncbi:MAG: N-acetyltransferase family protein, partial [Eubacterium sp.]|nr:N-acetyltransferase family protein [Eubacterium sp.]
MIIRKARVEDSDSILEIYAPYILNTTITFEYTVPSSADFRRRVEKIISEYPYFVCEEGGEALGYCYGSRYMERAAFGWDMELSVYLKDKSKGRGIGKALYGAVIDTAELMNIKNLYGLIASPNPRSEKLHADLGFRLEAVMKKTGWKFCRWI